jgi:hypothetical protein
MTYLGTHFLIKFKYHLKQGKNPIIPLSGFLKNIRKCLEKTKRQNFLGFAFFGFPIKLDKSIVISREKNFIRLIEHHLTYAVFIS